ncbi:AraC family transcriptional regulator [Sphingobium estronivorans]|uniref:AraC family transcriptional regulator n=1 Tax=Sphingobium estronivorans TaxID=1577690 RepID=UPI00123B3AF4|nr:AraC family transcriptional regulator [Sphingobium estronivorans]
MTEFVRTASLTGYDSAMRSLGVDPGPLLREAGLSAELLAHPEQPISTRALRHLLEQSADLTGCITLGLRMAEERAISDLGVASLVIAHQPTLGDVLNALQESIGRINSNLVLQMRRIGQEVVLRQEFSLNGPEPTRQSTDLGLGVLARLCFSIVGDGWSPLSVCFSHEAPPAPQMPIVGRLFRCDPQFDCEFNGLIIAARDLDRPNLRADQALARHAHGLMEIALPHQRTIAQDVEQMILLSLSSGRATVQRCAASMGLAVRTLQRMLDVEGTSFSDLLHRTRMRFSMQYLINPRMRVTEVADLLGYASTGAFTRWHAQTFGMSPQQWRAQHIGKPGDAQRSTAPPSGNASGAR